MLCRRCYWPVRWDSRLDWFLEETQDSVRRISKKTRNQETVYLWSAWRKIGSGNFPQVDSDSRNVRRTRCHLLSRSQQTTKLLFLYLLSHQKLWHSRLAKEDSQPQSFFDVILRTFQSRAWRYEHFWMELLADSDIFQTAKVWNCIFPGGLEWYAARLSRSAWSASLSSEWID